MQIKGRFFALLGTLSGLGPLACGSSGGADRAVASAMGQPPQALPPASGCSTGCGGTSGAAPPQGTPANEAAELSREEQARLWEEWARRGPQGPIEDDDEPEFP